MRLHLELRSLAFPNGSSGNSVVQKVDAVTLAIELVDPDSQNR